MARARNIKPGFFQNEELAELEPIDRLAFIALWTVCDYKGCLEYRPKRLKVQLLPYDNVDIEKTIKNLESMGFVQVYQINDESYIKIINFEKHQNPHKNERDAGSEIPDIDGTTSDIIGTTRADSLKLIPDSLKPITESVESEFNQFWSVYLKKDKKKEALRAWIKHKPPIDEVMFHLSWKNKTKDWQKNDHAYVPMASTYINQARWEDPEPEEKEAF